MTVPAPARLAIIAGSGGLPAALVASLAERPLICAPEGFAPAGLDVDQTFRVERLALFLHWLEDQGVTEVAFAGAVQRPRLDPSLFDPATATMVPRLLAAMGQGDDATLREVLAIFEEAGFALRGVADLAPALVPGPGVYAGGVTAQDETDAARAAAIVQALGAVDVGQGCVVAGGLCLAVEALPGTDAMLGFVAQIPASLRPARGLFYKAPKPAQDRRIDLPTLGVQTLRHAAAAGLGGVVWQAGGVICLDLPAMQQEADALGLTLWAR
ncbi:LpxI family protein [Tabrizicola sp.]|uniref:LpxI family protein n=1 Tax=Tabrizicola sp. TaxID=2005166 RepID=UPI003D27C2FF